MRLIAEPHLAKRDEKRRNALYEIVGRGSAKAKAVLLMNGERNQSAIIKEAGIDKGNLSRLIKALVEAELIESGSKVPKLKIPVPQGFPDRSEGDRG